MDPEETGPRARIKIACDDCRRGKRKVRVPYSIAMVANPDALCAPNLTARVFQDEDLVLSLREEIKALRDALKNTQSGNVERQMVDPDINHDTRDSSFAFAGLSSSISEGCSTPLGEDQAFESRSSHAMNELSSLMLQLDVADIGEPSFTLSASKVPQTKTSNSPDIKFDVEVRNGDCTLTKFYETTNAYLHTPEDRLSETAVWLQLSYQAALILIHRPLLSEASGSKAGRFSLTVATTAAAAISRTVREFGATRKFTAIAPQIIDYISIAATMHLLNATSGKNRLGRQSANGLRTCVQTLSDMTPAWEKRAQDSLEHIQNLAHRWEVVWALPIQHSQVLACGARPLNTDQDFGGLGPESHAAVDVYNVFDDTTLNTAAETLWGTEGTADHDWILQAAEGIPLSNEGLWDFDWQHLGGA
ncbi:unnamed protein product [Aureobasidium pullulans]|nr:unnamed protein product [Aureobasidium pullulans]